MTKFPFEMRRLSRSSKASSTEGTMYDSIQPLDASFEYPSEKMGTAEKRLTSRFSFVPQQPEISIDSIFDDVATKPSRSPSPYQGHLTTETFETFSSSRPLHSRKHSSSSMGSDGKSRTRSIFSLDGRRGSLSTMMCNAAASGDTAQVGRLIGAGADPKKNPKGGLSPIHLAAIGGHLSVLKSLVMHGAKLDVVDSEGRTPLHAAVLAGQVDVVPFLVSYGAPVGKKDKGGCTAMDYARTQSEDQVESQVEGDMGNKVRFSYVFGQTDKQAKRASFGSTTSHSRRPSIEAILRTCAEAEGKMI